MPHLQSSNRLSWGDALFLYLERQGMPLHVASVMFFEGVIPLEACTEFIDSKLPLIPRYRQRVVSPPFNFGLPSWELDPEFDVRNHVRQLTLKRGTDGEIKKQAAKILSKVMDRQRPLWDLTLMHDLKRKRTAVLVRVHHSLCDGISGVALMNVIMDPTPLPHPAPRKKQAVGPPPPKDPLSTLLDALVTTPFYLFDRMLSAQSEVLNIAQGVLARAEDAVQINRFAPELAAPVERLPFNVTCFGPQKFACAEVPLAEIKAVKKACETTVNDVILTVVTLAIRRYVELHGVDVNGRRLRVVVPVNVRDSSNENELGNRISFLPLSVPLDARDPKELLAAVRERMVFLKGTQAAELVGLAGSLLAMAPLPLQAAVWPVVSQLPISVCNTIITNVPGPQVPLYLLGHKMLRWYPYVPIGGEMGVNIAVLTYDGTAYFGFTGDVKAAPDLKQFEEFLRESFAELKAAAGLKPARRKRARARVRGARKAKAAATPPIAPVVTMPEPPATPAEEIAATEDPKKTFAARAG